MTAILSYTKAKTELTFAEKIGQLFMPAAFINDTEAEITTLENLIRDYNIGSLCFFHSRASAATNFEGKKKIIYNNDSLNTLKKIIKRYQSAAKYPLLISIDAEWGLAMRIENTPKYPYAITLGAIKNNTDVLFDVGKQIAIDCKNAGIHWNLAPVVDINNNPNNPVIGYRSFGENKELVTTKAVAFIKGAESENILTCIKHFPGHGDTDTDSHLGLPIIKKSKKELLDNELYPFKEIIKKNVDSVMVGHLAVPSLSDGENIPATLSSSIIKGVLRKELGFNGVVISDALNMHSVSKLYTIKGKLEWLAFNAGNDVLCFAENTLEGITTILKNASKNQIEESFERIWKLKEKAFKNKNQVQKSSSSSRLKEHDRLNHEIAENSITLFNGDDENIISFKKEGFTGINVGNKDKNCFFDLISDEVSFDSLLYSKLNIDTLKIKLINKKNILISLFPPQIKPANNFGFSVEEINFINELIRTKNTVIYLFGNPYVLNIFATANSKATLIVYENTIQFQKQATKHFLGNISALGKLPITIN